MTNLNYADIKADLLSLIQDKKCNAILVRLAWHDAGTYCRSSKTGGPQGCMRYAPVKDHGANAGLSIARDLLEPIKTKYEAISYADLWALAAIVAVEAAGGPKVTFRPGRQDGTEKEVTPDGRLPDASQGADHLRHIFGRMGFTDAEIVALSGAHALGSCHADRSGFEGAWTEEPLQFDNTYFKDIFGGQWEAEVTAAGCKQWRDKEKETMMLPTDLCLKEDPVFKPVAEKFAKDNEAFCKAFADSFQKLLELGYSDDALSAPVAL